MKNMTKIYISGPYSSGDVAVNVRLAILAGNIIAEHGGAPFIPHLSHFWHLVCPHEWKFWLDQDMQWLDSCDAMLRLPGISSGADIETEAMIKLNKPVFYNLDTCLAWMTNKQ